MWLKQRVWVLDDKELDNTIPRQCKARLAEYERAQVKFYYILTVIKLMEPHMRIKRKQLYGLTQIDPSSENLWKLFRVHSSDLKLIIETIRTAERDFFKRENRRFNLLSKETFSVEDFLYLVL